TVSIVHFLRGRTGLPDAAVRAEFERFSRLHERSIARTAILDDRDGFAAGAVKAVITGLVMVARIRLNIRIFSDLDDLTAWLVPRHEEQKGLPVTAHELREFLQAVRDLTR